MQKVYLDNAATTPMDHHVIDEMSRVMKDCFGNPSASHSLGRSAKGVIETSRRIVANCIGADSKEIIFTSGGTEADNMAVRCAVRDLGVKTIITSPIEHKAVLQTSQELEKLGLVRIFMVEIDELGRVKYDHLEALAKAHPKSLISIMQANNEIGTKVDLELISKISRENDCYFHSDTVQTVGHFPIHVHDLDIDFITCSAHKLHGPKGVGFLYANKKLPLKAMITGGGQERSQRAGTENVVGIAGLSKALEIACSEMDEDRRNIILLKNSLKEQLLDSIPGIEFNGDTTEEGSLYTVLSVSLPPTDFNNLILFKLDIEGICCSGGSACNSGASTGSHVLNALNKSTERQAIRFSFGRFTTKSDIDTAVKKLQKVMEPALQVISPNGSTTSFSIPIENKA